MSRSRPLWLRAPSRTAGIGKARARWVLATGMLLLILLVASAMTFAVTPSAFDDELLMQEGIVSALIAGGEYYPVAADALRATGQPIHPFPMMRLPTLAVLLGVVPPVVPDAVMLLLVGVVGYVWIDRLRRDAIASTPAMLAAGVMLAAGLILFVRFDLTASHSGWAGLLVALSLGLYRPGSWVSPVAIGLCAALFHEMAGLYLMVMASFALAERRRGEAAGWATATVMLLAVLALHAMAIGAIAGPLDGDSRPWFAFAGVGLAVRSVIAATALDTLPLLVATPLAASALLGWAGWAGWRDRVALRAIALIVCHTLVVAVFISGETLHHGLMIAPIALIGLAFIPDTLRDLSVAALDRRRVRVQRITR